MWVYYPLQIHMQPLPHKGIVSDLGFLFFCHNLTSELLRMEQIPHCHVYPSRLPPLPATSHPPYRRRHIPKDAPPPISKRIPRLPPPRLHSPLHHPDLHALTHPRTNSPPLGKPHASPRALALAFAFPSALPPSSQHPGHQTQHTHRQHLARNPLSRTPHPKRNRTRRQRNFGRLAEMAPRAPCAAGDAPQARVPDCGVWAVQGPEAENGG